MYRFFTGFMCLSSCISVASWSVYIVSFTGDILYFSNLNDAYLQFKFGVPLNPNYPFDQVLLAMASSRTHWAAWQILHSIDFTFFIASNMMVLDRMRTFSLSPQKYVKAARLGAAGVIAVCLVGICGSVVSALSRLQSASLAGQTASAYLSLLNATKLGTKNESFRRVTLDLWNSTRANDQKSMSFDSIQDFSEMSVLMVQVVLFLVMGIMCVRRVKSYLLSPRSASTENAARRLHQQIVVTAAVFFITFLPRATFATMKAVSNVRQDFNTGKCVPLCSDILLPKQGANLRCPIPFNMYFHMAVYLQYTPEFHLLVVLISSPLVQLVALWGMTSDRMLQAMGIRDARTREAGRRLLEAKSETSLPVVVNGVPKARA